ncbi:MAG: XrtA system polysaccharide chain length determinant [Pseudomonadota bacterium]
MNEILGIAYGFARAAWRRRWLAVAVAWIVALPAWLLVVKMPDRYEAAASVFVDTKTPLRPVLEGIAIQTDYASQLALVRKQLLSRPHLTAVARDLEPQAAASNPGTIEALVNELQQEIQIFSESSSGGGQDTLFTITYQNTDRDKSIKVVQGLVDKLMADTQSSSRSGANEVQVFLDAKIAEYEVQLREREQKLADFKKRNIGQIPGEGGDLLTRFDAEQAGLQKAETDISVSKGQKAELQNQLASAPRYMPGTSSGGAAGVPDVTQRRQQAEKDYEELLLRFTDRHPQVIALREQIATLKQAEEKELKELDRGGAGTGAIRSLSANPVYQGIQAQLQQVNVEIAAHETEARHHRQLIASLRPYVNMAPELEQELARLTRDYGSTKAKYDELVAKRQAAGISDDAARSGSILFNLVEPATASLDPVSPKRALLFIAVLFLACGAGVGLALIPQLFSPTFDDAGTLQRKLGLPVLGAISKVYSAKQRTHQKWQIFRVACATGTLVATAAALSAAGHAGARMLRALMT